MCNLHVASPTTGPESLSLRGHSSECGCAAVANQPPRMPDTPRSPVLLPVPGRSSECGIEQAHSYGIWGWPGSSGMLADPCRTGFSREEAGTSVGNAAAGNHSSRASALPRDLGVFGEYGKPADHRRTGFSREEAGTSVGDAAAGNQSSRASSLLLGLGAAGELGNAPAGLTFAFDCTHDSARF